MKRSSLLISAVVVLVAVIALFYWLKHPGRESAPADNQTVSQVTKTETESTPKQVVAGQDYFVIDSNIMDKPAIKEFFANKQYENKVVVIEFFSYGCPGCNSFEPYWQGWRLLQDPNSVVSLRIPATFEPGWPLLAKLFYTLEALGIERSGSNLVFAAIHFQGRNLSTEEAIKNFMQELAADKKLQFDYATFLQYLNSPEIEEKVKIAKQLFVDFGITSTPSVIINGKYRVEASKNLSKSNDLVSVIEYLVQKELNDIQAKKNNTQPTP